ncbi:MAG: hypothetical protein INQ03_20275 [Candidatus Heimdallarchaeota archaeon]|nr:hypothetical protein [Candidatus Heimdallarchaeota archaeon]
MFEYKIYKGDKRVDNDEVWEQNDVLVVESVLDKGMFDSEIKLIDQNNGLRRYSREGNPKNGKHIFTTYFPASLKDQTWNLLLKVKLEKGQPIEIIKDLKVKGRFVVREPAIVLSKFTMRLRTVKDESQLAEIDAIEISEDEVIDLEIPITEVHDIGTIFTTRLAAQNVKYISDLIRRKPIEVKEIAESNLKRILKWYDFAYAVLDKPNHPLRVEYRSSRQDRQKYKEQITQLARSEKGIEPITALGIREGTIEKLKAAGINTVGDMLKAELAHLIVLDFTKEKAKELFKKAEEYVGIKI